MADYSAASSQVSGCPCAARGAADVAAAAAVTVAEGDDHVQGVWAVAAQQQPGVVAAVQDAAGTATTAVQVEAYRAARTVSLHQRQTARTRDPWAHHLDHPVTDGNNDLTTDGRVKQSTDVTLPNLNDPRNISLSYIHNLTTLRALRIHINHVTVCS